MSQRLRAIFKTEKGASRQREKFLSRVFGIFSEEVVKLWTLDERAPYKNLGRPTIKTREGGRGHTLDFSLEDRASGCVYVAEMKCEIEYNNFKYFVLERSTHLDHHKKPAFEAFLKAARPSAEQTVSIGSKRIVSSGAILIWGAMSSEGKKDVVQTRGFHDVLSIEEVCRDLASWNCVRYKTLIEERQVWCNQLFAGLLEGYGS